MDSPLPVAKPVAKLLSSVKIYLDLKRGSGIRDPYIIPINPGSLPPGTPAGGPASLGSHPWWVFSTHSETWQTLKAVVLRCVDG